MKSIFSKMFHFHAWNTSKKRPDTILGICVIALSLVGIVMVYNSSVALAIRDFGTPYYYLYEQAKWFVLGGIAFIVCSKVPYEYWYKISLPLLCLVFVLLIAVFIPGIGISALGAHRWVNFGFFVLQPAELTKFSLIIYFAAWFSKPEKGRLGAFLLLVGMVVGLVILEPDLGTASIILLIAMMMYFFSGAPIKQFLLLMPLLFAGVLVLAIVSPYRLERLMTFVNPNRDPLGSSYQIRQAILALGSGGWTGVGLGRSRQKYEYLPEANTDSIFAIIGEEGGFLGALSVILLYVVLIWRGFRVGKAAPNPFTRLLALGIVSWISIQATINLSAMVALVPLTGVPLPLISYGGSSVIVLLSALGIVYNISRYTNES